MSPYKIHDQHKPHFLTLTTVGWVDVFSRAIYRDIILESLCFYQIQRKMTINAWVIMSNHLHLVARTAPPYLLSDVLRDFKKFTANQIIKSIKQLPESRKDWLLQVMSYHAKFNDRNRIHQFWQQDNCPKEINNLSYCLQKINYIHENPVRAGLVTERHHYYPSSAIDYAGGKGLLPVEIISASMV
ncbi:REP-associated tyrosine transposase [Lewinella cohaerens]|uniref:REP-associated tyrosine transposase n=1 Tax=Lewinella cohaerens TaxID=70995 RepID=UPI00037626FA|nr:transposase [Lewinella cohaerens]